MLKKTLCVLLCCALLCAFTPLVHAGRQAPVVFVPGYISSRLVMNEGAPDEQRVWKQKIADKVIAALKAELPLVVPDAGAALIGAYGPLFDTLAPYVDEVLEYLRMNDDGTSKYNVVPSPHSAADTRLDNLKKIGYYPDHDALRALGAAVGDKNVYCCTLDWRLGQVDNAAVLRDYIDEVLELTGADKVRLMGVSYGGQVAASYLHLYGGDRVESVVLQCPALDGSSIVSKLLSGEKFSIAFSDLATLYGTYSRDDSLLPALLSLAPLDGVNPLLRAFLARFLLDFFANFGSVWDLVPRAEYPALRDKLLRDGKHDEIMRKSDIYHEQIAVGRAETFRRLQSQGVRIAIVAGYGYRLAVDCGVNSDGVIDVASTTGAEAAPVGSTLGTERFYEVRTDDDPVPVSPDDVIDATGAYLPARTWFVADMLHGLGMNEEKVKTLMMKLLLTDEITDVYADPAYPRFLTSQNACRDVFCAFDGCAEGFATPYAVTLRITNLSAKNAVSICGIDCRGAKLRFGYTAGTKLQPGESMTAEVYGALPERALSALRIDVRYVAEKEKYSVGGSRTQYFRAADEALFPFVLTEPLAEDAPAIRDGKAVKTIRMDWKTFWADCLYRLLRPLLMLRESLSNVRIFG